MADVEVILGTEGNAVLVCSGKGVDEERETSTSTDVCFDRVVQQGAKKTGFKISIKKLGYETMEDYIALDNELEKMVSTPGVITIREVRYFEGGSPYLLKRVYHDCILADDKYSMEPESNSVLDLKFNAGSRDKVDPVPYNG